VTAQDHIGLQRPKLTSRRTQPQEWMHCEPFTPRAEVRRGAEHVGTDEHVAVGPPERHLVPRPAVLDGDARKGADRSLRNDVVTNTEPRGEGRAVAVVPVEQLEDARRSARCANSLLDAFRVDGVYDPDAAVFDERVRATLHELRDDPAEPAVELVAESDSHPGKRTGTP